MTKLILFWGSIPTMLFIKMCVSLQCVEPDKACEVLSAHIIMAMSVFTKTSTKQLLGIPEHQPPEERSTCLLSLSVHRTPAEAAVVFT